MAKPAQSYQDNIPVGIRLAVAWIAVAMAGSLWGWTITFLANGTTVFPWEWATTQRGLWAGWVMLVSPFIACCIVFAPRGNK